MITKKKIESFILPYTAGGEDKEILTILEKHCRNVINKQLLLS